MTKKNPDSNLKEQDYGKRIKGLTTEELEKELLILERRRIVLQNRDPEIEARAEQQRQEEEEAEWEAELQAMEPEKRAQAEAEVDAATEEYMRDIERSVDFYMKL